MAIWTFIALIMALLAFLRASRAEQALARQKKELDDLRAWLKNWYDQSVAARERAAAAALGTPPADASTSPHAAHAATSPDAATAASPGIAGTPAVVTSATVATGALAGSPAAIAGSPGAPDSRHPVDQTTAAASPAAAAAAYAASGAHTPSSPLDPALAAAAGAGTTASATPPAAEPAQQPFTTHPGTAAEEADAFENRIGGRWLLYIGIAALVLGASYFVKYAFDNQWITEPMRVGLGLLGGAVLVLAGQRFVSRGLTLYGQVLTGGGVGVLYLAIYAAQQWYHLINQPTATAGMVLITALGVWLADRQRSQVLALFAIAVGFATPFLIADDPGSQIALFLYDAVLVCGTLFLARRRDWPLLNLVSYVLTLFTIASWLELGYDPRRYLVTELFLTLFLGLFLWIWHEMRRDPSPGAQLTRPLLLAAPVLYHLTSVSILFPQRGALLVYLIACSAAGVSVARRAELPWLRLITWVGASVPLLAFLVRGVPNGWLIAAWIALLAIYGLHLVAQVDRVQDEAGPLPWEEVLLLHANGIWLLLAADALLKPRMAYAEARTTLALAAWYGLIALAARGWRPDVALHAAALTATFGAAAAGFYFDGPWFTIALALDGAALMWLSLKADRRWMYLWGGLVLVLSIVRALAQFSTPAPVSYVPLLNPRALAGLFVVGVMAAIAWLTNRARAHGRPLPGARDTLIVGANLLALVVLSAEVYQFFDHRAWRAGVGGGAGESATRVAEAETNAQLSRELSLSLLWAVYAVAMVFAGIKRRYRPIRYLAILLLGFTILKVFTVDLATLDRVSKMLSVMGLGVLLLLASYLYQRVSADAARRPAAPTPAPEPPASTPPSASAATTSAAAPSAPASAAAASAPENVSSGTLPPQAPAPEPE